MKLSELSYREYIALEVVPSFAGKISDSDAVRRAFGVADLFLKQCGKHTDKVAAMEARAVKAETALEVLQSIHVNMGEDFASRIALTDIWEFLGAKSQTQAMEVLRLWKADVLKGLNDDRT